MADSMTYPNRIRTPEDDLRFRLSLTPIDAAFFASEQRWGVGRLERLVSPSTLAAYARGWDAYRQALDASDPDAVAEVGPKMIAALAFMDREAEAAGHQPLDVSCWETPLGDDGTILVLVRTQSEQAAVIRANNATVHTALPAGGLQATNSLAGLAATLNGHTAPTDVVAGLSAAETTLPPDLAIAVRATHEGRAIEVWDRASIARLILAHGSVARQPRKWQGSPAHSGQRMAEGDAADLVRTGFPLDADLTEPPATTTPLLDF
jgi:hypothetical protein